MQILDGFRRALEGVFPVIAFCGLLLALWGIAVTPGEIRNGTQSVGIAMQQAE